MKTLLILALMTASAILSGCATAPKGVVLDTVGPPMNQAPASSTNGALLVYSAYEVNADFNARDPNRPEYSDYTIFTPNGKQLQKVHNNSGTVFQDAVPVWLSPGKYEVRALANGYGLVTVPVLIEPGRKTLLHLEGGGWQTDAAMFNQNNVVRLADGQIIGFKAKR